MPPLLTDAGPVWVRELAGSEHVLFEPPTCSQSLADGRRKAMAQRWGNSMRNPQQTSAAIMTTTRETGVAENKRVETFSGSRRLDLLMLAMSDSCCHQSGVVVPCLSVSVLDLAPPPPPCPGPPPLHRLAATSTSNTTCASLRRPSASPTGRSRNGSDSRLCTGKSCSSAVQCGMPCTLDPNGQTSISPNRYFGQGGVTGHLEDADLPWSSRLGGL